MTATQDTPKVASHTPGPWAQHPYTSTTKGHCEATGHRPAFDYRDIVIGSGDTIVATVQSHTMPYPQCGYPGVSDEGELEANARLIAAAPELLATMKSCDEAFADWQVGQIPGRPDDILALVTRLRAAIAKAEGRDA